jgi:hypothetical protein
MELPKVLDYILLVLAILLGSVGFLKNSKAVMINYTIYYH